MSVRLSVVIVSYNTRELLRECLDSIRARTRRTEYEVIVVENASTDGTREMLARDYPGIVTILSEENRRWAGGNNQGAGVAGGEYLLFLNSDTVVCDDALDLFVRFMDDHPDAALAGCRLLNPDGSLQRSCRGIPDLLNLFSEAFFLYRIFPRSGSFGRFYMTTFDHDSVRRVDMVTGAALMIRAGVFREIGPFDESFHFYGEETDYCYRAAMSGHGTFFCPVAAIIHHGGGSQDEDLRYYRNHYNGLTHFLKKHYQGVKLFAALTLKNAGVALRIPVYFLLGCATADRRILRKSIYYLKLLF